MLGRVGLVAVVSIASACGRLGFEAIGRDGAADATAGPVAVDGGFAASPDAGKDVPLRSDLDASEAFADTASTSPEFSFRDAGTDVTGGGLPPDADARPLGTTLGFSVVHGTTSATAPVVERTVNADGVAGSVVSLPETRHGVRWAVAAGDSRTGVVGLVSVANAFAELVVLRARDGGFTHEWTEEIQDDFADLRAVDIARTAMSGTTMVVWSDGGSPLYRLFDGAAWSPVRPVFATPPSNSAVVEVRLVAAGSGDGLGLAVKAADGRAFVARWDVGGWGAALPLEGASDESARNVDLAFENASGTLLVVWGRQLRWATLAPGAHTLSPAAPLTVVGGPPMLVDLRSRQGSNHVALLVCTDGTSPGMGATVWDGTSWSEPRSVVSPALSHWRTEGRGPVRAAGTWVGNRFITAFSRNDGRLGYMSWQAGVGWGQIETLDVPVTAVRSLLATPLSGAALFLFSDDGGRLRIVRSDGIHVQLDAMVLTTTLSSDSFLPFVVMPIAE